MTHLIEKISKGNDSNNFNDDSNNFFFYIFRTDVTIADGEHSSACKINRIDVFLKIRVIFDSYAFDPIIFRVDLG
jgi:hypothetical protein